MHTTQHMNRKFLTSTDSALVFFFIRLSHSHIFAVAAGYGCNINSNINNKNNIVYYEI